MSLLYHAYVYLEFLILACTIYILAPYRVIFNNIDNIIFIRMIGNRGQIYKGV